MKDNKKTIIKGIILFMLVAIIGTTYAYFTANITGNESTSTIVVIGGRMEIVYDNLSGTIEAFDIYPKSDAWVTKNFTVTGTNTTDKNMKYKLGLKVDNNTFSSGALTYSLTSINTSNKGTIVASKTNQVISGSEVTFGTGIYPKGENMVHTYTFELFFKDTGENQNKEQGKQFAGYITIEEAQFNEIALSASNLSSIGYTDGEVPSSLIIPEKYKVGDDWNQVTSIGELAFKGNTTLTNLTLNEGLKKIENDAFASATNLTGILIMPSTLKAIGIGAFYKTGITGLTLNEGLENIGNSAFSQATSLTGTLTIPSSVKTIGDGAFVGTGITGLTLNEGLQTIENNAFSTISVLTGHITIPSTTKVIKYGAFYGTSITGLTLNEGLQTIENNAFSTISTLTGHIIVPSTVKNIEYQAFYQTNISNLTLNEGLERIGRLAFANIKNLTGTIIIPSTIKTIEDSAFRSTNITTINYRGTQEQWNQISIGTNVFPSGVTINYGYTGA